MPQAPTPNSAGLPQPDNASAGGHLPSGKPGGVLTISRREALALIAFDTEDDEKRAIARARKETSLTDDQLRRLKDRAGRARSKGFSLKSGSHEFKPTNYDGDDEMLLGKQELRDDEKKGKGKSGAPKASSPLYQPSQPMRRPGASATKEAQARWTRLHECDGDRTCGPCRRAEARDTNEARLFEVALSEASGPAHLALMVEKWSDAARAAAAAARRTKSKGGNWRKAARREYLSQAQKGRGGSFQAQLMRQGHPAAAATSFARVGSAVARRSAKDKGGFFHGVTRTTSMDRSRRRARFSGMR